MADGSDAVRAKLVEVLPEMWDFIPQELLRKLVESMPRRVKAVIAAKDGILNIDTITYVL